MRENELLANKVPLPVLDILLQLGLIKFTSNEAFSIKNCVGWVGVECVLGGIPNSTCKVNVTQVVCKVKMTLTVVPHP